MAGPPSSADISARLAERVRVESAASRVVEDLVIDLTREGYEPQQVKGVASAVREYLVQEPGYRERARKVLGEVGFNTSEADTLLDGIISAMARNSVPLA